MSVWLGGATERTTPRKVDEITGLGLGVTKADRAALKKDDKKGYCKV